MLGSLRTAQSILVLAGFDPANLDNVTNHEANSPTLNCRLVRRSSALLCSPQKQDDIRKSQLHTATDWLLRPSFTLDTVCLLNVLTGDPFYVGYYEREYARFEPQLTPAARAALANLKRKIKDVAVSSLFAVDRGAGLRLDILTGHL